MKQFWQEVLPIDSYIVISNGLLEDYDRKPLTFLYQPLIGSTCFSLYMTLWAQLEENRLTSAPYTHHSLMSVMNMNLKAIYNARLKLEGIGLLKTFLKSEDDKRSFIYELHRPLSPEQFFSDGMLNVFLFSKIGKNQYSRLKQFFSDDKVSIINDGQNITKSFDEVFSSGGFEYNEERLREEVHDAQQHIIGNGKQANLKITNFKFDFDLLFAGVRESLVPRKAFTPMIKEAIEKLAFLYGIDAVQMTNIVISAIDENNEIVINELRKSARDWYQFENEERLPNLIDKIQPLTKRTQHEQPQTKEEHLVKYLETTSPRKLLIDLSGGTEPSKADLKIVEDIMFNQKLQPGVVNVLLQYVMLKTDMKLTKAYIEKIASHWARKKIDTVKEAMELAINEHRQYTEWAKGEQKERKAPRRTVGRTEKLPEWFIEQKKSASEVKNKIEEDEFDYEAEKLRLEKKFKK